MSPSSRTCMALVLALLLGCSGKKSRDAGSEEDGVPDPPPDVPGEVLTDPVEDPAEDPVEDPAADPDASDPPVEVLPDGEDPDEDADEADGDLDAEDEEVGCTGPSSFGDVRITSDSSYSWNPDIAWSGSEFGISWRDDRDGNTEVYFARVSGAGAKVGSDVRITDATGGSLYPSIAWAGSQWGVGWYDTRDTDYEIYFVPFSPVGAKTASDARITFASEYSMHPSVAWTGSEFGMAWRDERDGTREIYFARVTADGALIGTDVRLTSVTAFSDMPSLAWTGSQFAVAWDDYRDGNTEIYMAFVSDAGVKLGSDLRITNAAGTSGVPSLVWTGSEFGIAFEDWRGTSPEIYFARVDASGAKIGSELRVTYTTMACYKPRMAWTGSEFGITWYDYRDGQTEIYLAIVSADGVKVGSDYRVTTDSAHSEAPHIAWSGSDFGVTWWDDRDGNYEVYFALVARCP